MTARRTRPWWVSPEGLVALIAAAIGFAELASTAMRGPYAANALFLLGACLSLALLPRWPVPMMVVGTTAAWAWANLLYGVDDQPLFSAFVLLMALTFFGTMRGGPLWAGVVVAIGCIDSVVTWAAGAELGDTLPVVFWLLAVWALGWLVHRRRQESVVLAERAVRAEAEKEVEAQQAVAEERARIARELHDVISHNVSVMVIQASVERRLLQGALGAASTVEALEAIEVAGRDTLLELRRLLGVLRKDDQPPSLSPQPGIGEVGALVEQVRSAGVEVNLSVTGDSRLPTGVDLAAYRIAQEALTNVLKHARAKRVEVQIRTDATKVSMRVSDDGRGPQPGGSPGHGLLGMKERVALYAGSLTTGPGAEGGFEVAAVLPFGETA